MKNFAILFIFMFLIGCSSVQFKSEYTQTADELEQELKQDNLTPVQKVIIKHAITELNQAHKTEIKNEDLRQQIVSESKLAGAGKLIYVILSILGLVIVAFIISKIKSLFFPL